VVDLGHLLVRLSELIDWEVFEQAWVGFFPAIEDVRRCRRA
jgi:hypothetical protein